MSNLKFKHKLTPQEDSFSLIWFTKTRLLNINKLSHLIILFLTSLIIDSFLIFHNILLIILYSLSILALILAFSRFLILFNS
jgi:hypothetical protein